MFYIFAKGYDRHACDYTEVHFGTRKTAADAKELCKDIHRTRPEFCEVWYERSNEPEEQYLSYRGSCYNRRYYQKITKKHFRRKQKNEVQNNC